PLVAATQGSRDQAKTIASIFLTGCDQPPTANSAAPQQCGKVLHVPEGWPTPIQLHLNPDIHDFSDFFRHRTHLMAGRPGLAACRQEGVEGQGQRILFYVGEGRRDGFDAIFSENVILGSFSVGDQSVRYLLTVSCNLFAHGPRVNGDFTKPEAFTMQRSNG